MSAFECEKCEKDYILSIELNGSHRQVNCVAKPNISNCKKYGTDEYYEFPTYFKKSITGCIKCKNAWSNNGTSCDAYTFSTKDNCSDFNPYQD